MFYQSCACATLALSVCCLWLGIADAETLSAMDELLKDINDKLSSLSDGQDTLLSRVDKLEASEKKSNREGSKYMLGSLFGDSSQRHGGAPLPGATLSTGASGSLGTAGNIPQAGAVARVDNTVQDEYQSIKDKVSSVKIPQELHLF